MEVLGDVVTRASRSNEPALRVPAVGRRYDYRRFCTSAWKTGNFLRHLGVRSGVGVAIADDPLPEPVLTFYGAAELGAVVGFGPPREMDVAVRALVWPAAGYDDHAVGPETKGVVYGDSPVDPSISHFERDVWSENPTEPPDPVDPDDALLWTQTGTYSHSEVLDVARTVVDHHGLGADSVVAVRGSFTDPSVVIAGLVAPLVAGGTCSLGPDADGTHVVGGPNSDIEPIDLG